MRLPWQTKPEVQSERRTITEAEWYRLFDRHVTKAGSNVTSETALYSSVVAACLAVRAEAKATLPIHLYRQDDDRRVMASDRPEYSVLKSSPNPTQTAAQLWSWQQITTDAYGNAYMLRERKGATTTALYPLIGETLPIIEHRRGAPRVTGYKHRDHGTAEWIPLPLVDVLHFPSAFTSSDGITGRSLIDIARESIGLDIAGEEFVGRVMTNGTHFGTVLTTDQTLTTDDIDDIKLMLSDGHGVAPAGKARLFTKGIKPEVLGYSLKDADLIQARRYNVERICGVFKVPLVKVQAMWFGTYSNTEQGDLAFSKDCVVPMCVTSEQVVNAKMFPDGKHFVKFDMRGLMRGDFATRMEGLAAGVNGGIFTPNEARAWEDLDPLPGGDELRFPLNSMPASEVGEDDTEQESEQEPDPDENARNRIAAMRAAGKSRVALQRSMRGMFEDAGRRIVRREVNDIRREAERNLRSVDDFRAWLDAFYRDFPDFYLKQIEPIVRSYGSAIADMAAAEANGSYSADALDSFVRAYSTTSSKRYMSSHLGQLKKLLDEEADHVAAIEERLSGWEETQPSKLAARESVEAGGAFAKFAFTAAGVVSLMWVNTSTRSCPYCESLDGRIVGIESVFAGGGSDVAGLPVSRDTFHPPLHAGCECTIVPS